MLARASRSARLRPCSPSVRSSSARRCSALQPRRQPMPAISRLGWAGACAHRRRWKERHYGPATGKGRGWQEVRRRRRPGCAGTARQRPEGGPEQRIADQRGDHETLGQGFRRQAGMDLGLRRAGAAAPAGRRRPASAASCRRTPAGPGPPRWRRRWRSTSTGVAPGRPRRYPAAPAAGPATAQAEHRVAGQAQSRPCQVWPGARRVKRPASIRAKPTATTRCRRWWRGYAASRPPAPRRGHGRRRRGVFVGWVATGSLFS